MLRSGVSSSGTMIDQASKDTDKMLGNDEVPSGYLKDNDSHLHSQEGGNVSHQKPESKGQTLPVYDYVKANNSMIWEPCAVPNVGYSGPFYRPDGYPLPFAHHDIVRQQLQFNPFENNVYARNPDYLFPIEKRFSCFPPVKMLSQAQPHQFQTQEFQYFVVIDFEATCDKEKIPDPQEIIEFPSVLVNSSTGQLEAFFQTYVRPAYHQHLTDFCKELTGIQQIQVDRGVSLSEALQMHDKWLEKKGIKHKNFVVVTWSNWDCRVMLETECRYKRIRKPSYFNRWINLKVPFQNIFQGVRCNLKEAVQHAGLTWEGRAHCGLDDARNTARLLVHLMDKGVKFCVTNSLISQSREFPMNSEPFSLSDHNQRNPKPREMIGAFAEFHPFMGPYGKEKQTYCFCGVLSSKCIVRKPGPAQGRYFFGCGNWTAARRAACNYFVWASP